MKKYITGLRYGTWLTRLYVLSVPFCILAGVGLVIVSFIINSMLLFLAGIGFGIGAIALLQCFTIEEDSIHVVMRPEWVPPEKEGEYIPEAAEAVKEPDIVKAADEPQKSKKQKKIKKENKIKKEKKRKPDKEPVRTELPEQKEPQTGIGEEKESLTDVEEEKEQRTETGEEKDLRADVEERKELRTETGEKKDLRADVEERKELRTETGEEKDLRADVEEQKEPPKKVDKEEERREKEKELISYDEKKIKQVFYKYKVRKDHKAIIIDEWKEKAVKQCPAYIWLHRGQVHILLMGKETQEVTMSAAKAGTLTYVKGVVCKAKDEYLQFRKESLLSTVFSPYLPKYHEGEKNGRPVIYKNLFAIGSGMRVTNTSAKVIMDLLQPAFQVEDRVTTDRQYNAFYKEIYKTGILFREQVLTVKEYKDKINEILQHFAMAGISDKEYEGTLQALFRNKLITEEYVAYYLQYRERLLAEQEEKKRKKKNKRNKKGK